MDARRLRQIGLVVLAACAPNVLLVLARLRAPADGTATFPSAPPWGDGVGLANVVGQAGDLRPGDRVVSVDGVALDAWTGDLEVGQVLHYGVIRDDGPQQTVEVTLRSYPLGEIALEYMTLNPLLIALLAMASFVYLRRPADPAARALFLVAALVPMGLTAFPYSTQVVDVLTGRWWPLIISDTASMLMWGAILHFMLIFPQPGPMITRRPRLAATAAFLVPAALYAIHLVINLPGAGGGLARIGVLITISVPAANVVPFVVAGLMIVRYRRIRDVAVRQRLAWVFLAFGIGAVAYLGFGRLPEWFTGEPLVPWAWQTLFFLPVPVAVGAAVLRYKLFDIEIFLRRSLVYFALGAVLSLLYLGIASAFAWLLGTPVELGPLLAGGIVVLLVLSMREGLRRMVMRLVFGDRDDPYEVVRRLGRRLEATASAESALQSVTETLAQALRLPYVSVELSGLEPHAATYGTPTGTATTIQLTHQGEHVGQLVLDTGRVREPFGPGDQRLLDGLARQVGMTAHNLLLTARLQRSLGRVVAAREEERRRLRRDIHDGLGPVLASGTMRLELARALLDTDPVAAQAVLADLAGTQQQALSDLRRLVEGLRPPVLDQLGLVGALRQRADRFAGLIVTVDTAGDLEPLPAAVEVAAYHIVSEALTNVVKHAGAGMCVVRLAREGAALVVEVGDDGIGLPDDYRAGTGLHSIRERAVELGGSAGPARAGSGGTIIRASLPLPGPA